MFMFGKKSNDNGEKLYRYSIRKYHFGAASVAIAALMFFANGGGVAAAEVVTPATANPNTHQLETTMNSGGDSSGTSGRPENTKEINKPAEVSTQASVISDRQVEKETGNSTPLNDVNQDTLVNKVINTSSVNVTDLQTALAELESKLTNVKDDEEKGKFNTVVVEAKKLLGDKEATQEQVNQQLTLVKETISSVEALLKKQESKVSEEETKKSEKDRSAEVDASNRETAVPARSARGRKGRTTEVQPADSENATPTVETATANKETAPKALPTYTNGAGTYKLAEEMKNIVSIMKANGADETTIAAVKANYDKLNETLGAHEDGVLSEADFASATANLTAARDAVEKVLDKKFEEYTRTVNPDARSRQTREYGLNFQDSREYYYEDGKRGISPYSKYTYVFHNYRATNAPKFDHQPVSNAEKYIHVRVDPTDTGFLWTVSVNAGRFSNTTNDSYWFTIPKGQHYKQGSANVDVQNLQGTNSYQGDGSLEGAMRQAGLLQVNKGANLKGVFRYGKVGANAYKTDNLEALARENVDALTDKGLYNRVLEQGEEQKLSNEKFKKITKTGGDLYYFEQPSNVFKYTITFETVGDASDPNRNDPDDLVYAAGFKGITRSDKVYRVLVNQWHAQTDAETSNIDRYRMTLKNGGTFFVEQNKYYNKAWSYSDYLGIGKWYGTKNLNSDIKKVDGIITYGNQQNFTSIDFTSYINYKPQKGKDFEQIKYEANHDHGQTFKFYREDGTPISQKDLGAEAGGSPGVHTYYYRRYFTSDGSSDSGKFRFIVKLQNPVLAPTTKYAGENHTFTASGSTKGSPVTLWREYIDESGHKQTQEIDTKVVENNNGTVTFKDITLEKGKYYVHSKITTDSYLDYNGKKHSTVESDPVTENQKNVIVEPPVVKINGHKLTTNANDNQFIIYKGANFNPTFQVENEGNQVNYLKVTNIPNGVWFNNVNGSDKEKVNMASGSTHTLADNTVENSARDGEASVTVRNHNNREVVYKFKYIIADVQASNASRDKRVGDTLGDPNSYVKAVVNGGEGNQYFPSGMRFGWVTNRATLADKNTVLDRPGNIGDYNVQVIFPNNRPVEKEINHVNYTIYTPVAKTIPVRFNVTDSVAPTVKMTNPNNTDSTLGDSENGAPEVEVFRGATLNIPLKMHDNNVHGKINIKQISGLPAGVTLKDGNTVINNGNTLSKNSGSETNPATATITGKVAPNATLGTNVVTLKVSDDATENVDRGNQATLKFKVKTYDLAFEEKGTRVDDNTRSDVLRLNENSVDPNHYLAITDGRNVTNNWGNGMVFRYLKENNEIREHVSFDKIGKHSVKARAYFPANKTSTQGLPTNPSGLTGDTAATNGRGFLEKTIEFNVKPNAPTIAQPQFYGTASSKPTVTVGNLPTNAQLQNGATVTVELYQGNTRVASKTVTDGNSTTTLSAENFTANLTEGQPVHAVVKVSGGRGATAYSVSSDNSERRNVTGRSTLSNLASDKLVVQVQDLANNRGGTLSEREKQAIKQAIFEANKNGVLRGKQVSDINISDTGLITALDKDNKIAELQIDPKTNVVTRFAHIRNDYNITFTNNGKPANRSTDPGFEWSSDHKSLIYKFDATSGVGLDVNEVLKTITATPKNPQNQPSLTTVTGNDKASGETNSNSFSKNATSGYFSKNGVGVNVLDLVNPTTYRGGGNIDNTTNKLVDKNRTGLNSSNVGTTLGNDSISAANGANAISLSNVVKKANGTDSLVVKKQLYLMPKYTNDQLLQDRGNTNANNTNVINVYFVPVDPTAPQVERSTSNTLATTSAQASRLADNTSFASLAKVTDNYDKDDVTNPLSNTVRNKLNMWVKKGDTKVQIVENGVEKTDVIANLKKEVNSATYEVFAKTTDASGNKSHEDNSDGQSLGFFRVGYNLVARQTINVVRGERISADELKTFIQVQEGNQLVALPQGATVTAALETSSIRSGSEETKTIEATVNFGENRTQKVTLTYKVLNTFPIARTIYDFKNPDTARQGGSSVYYHNGRTIPDGMTWIYKGNDKVTKPGDEFTAALANDPVGTTTNYEFGGKYNYGRFTNNPTTTGNLEYTERVVHKVFDITDSAAVTVSKGDTLTVDQAKAAVKKADGSDPLPEGTTYEWVGATDTSTPGKRTYRVKVTLPVSQSGSDAQPVATQVRPSKTINVTVKVKPTAPTITPKDNGDVLITPTNETNVDKVSVTFTPQEGTNPAEVTYTAKKNASGVWEFGSGAPLTVDPTTGVFKLKDRKVKDGTTVTAKALTTDGTGSVESNPATGIAGNGDAIYPTVIYTNNVETDAQGNHIVYITPTEASNVDVATVGDNSGKLLEAVIFDQGTTLLNIGNYGLDYNKLVRNGDTITNAPYTLTVTGTLSKFKSGSTLWNDGDVITTRYVSAMDAAENNLKEDSTNRRDNASNPYRIVFKVRTQAAKYTPTANTLTRTDQQAKHTNDQVLGAVSGTNIARKEIVGNIPNEAGVAVVKVTYNDGSTENVNVPINVTPTDATAITPKVTPVVRDDQHKPNKDDVTAAVTLPE
ncbi:MAG: YSIRK-type signal peptide-containing protein, partial [Streptococcus mitis]|nr:YSIRK-type signal peptide-containing protein [Streptococcus mitis]